MSDNNKFTLNMVVEKTPHGIIKSVEKTNWSGFCIVCSRKAFATAKKKHPELSRPGVYALLGKDKSESAKREVFYVGAMGGINKRIEEFRRRGKDSLRLVVAFTTLGSATPLNTAMENVLVSRLLAKATVSGRRVAKTPGDSSFPGLSRGDEIFCDDYFNQMMLILPHIGIDVFDSFIAPATTKTPTAVKEPATTKAIYFSGERPHIFRFKDSAKKTREAFGHERMSKGKIRFVVLRGSCAKKEQGAISKLNKSIRRSFVRKGVLRDDGSFYSFIKDCDFDSPSQAGVIVSGRSSNGLTDWVDENGRTLKQNRVELPNGEEAAERAAGELPATAQQGEFVFQENGIKAVGYPTGFRKEFTVREGSFSVKQNRKGLGKHNIKLRAQLVAQGILAEWGNVYRFSKNRKFSSPSQAAAVVSGGEKNGREVWIDAKSGKTLKELQEC